MSLVTKVNEQVQLRYSKLKVLQRIVEVLTDSAVEDTDNQNLTLDPMDIAVLLEVISLGYKRL